MSEAEEKLKRALAWAIQHGDLDEDGTMQALTRFSAEEWDKGRAAGVKEARDLVGHAIAMAQDNAEASMTTPFRLRWTLLADTLDALRDAISALASEQDAPAETADAPDTSETQGRLGI